MSFKIYDRKLTFLESIRHGERVILHMDYDAEKDLIIAGGAAGVSVWKMHRSSALGTAHILEKVFTFDGCTGYVTRMIYDMPNGKIYAIDDRSAKVLNLNSRALEAELRDVNEALTAVCWYERNRFFITGCG
jgi:hypothetical protein